MLSEKRALAKLQKLKADYRNSIKTGYEHKAKNCLTCETRGACCLDAHFVNVHITRLESVAIRQTLEKLSAEKRREIHQRVENTIEKYDLKTSGDRFAQTFACPLFEKQVGCLVHSTAGKPAPCIQHACYESRADLPPDALQEKTEAKIERLNKLAYKNDWSWLPLPVWLQRLKPVK